MEATPGERERELRVQKGKSREEFFTNSKKIYGKKCAGRAGRLNGGQSTSKLTLRGKISFTIIYKWIEWVSEKGLPRTHRRIFAFCLLHVDKCYKLIFVNYKHLNITLWKDYLSYALTSLWSVGHIPRNYYGEFLKDGADHSLYIYIFHNKYI